MPRIGPYQLATLAGRVLTASAPTIVTDRGLRPAPQRPHVSALTSTEHHATHVAAWIQALIYRQAIGLVVDVEDADSLYCSAAVVVDVRCRVDHASTGGATLSTVWTLAAGAQHGTIGQPILAPPSAPATGTEPPPAPIAVPGSTAFSVAGYPVDAITGDLQWDLPQDAERRVQRALTAVGYIGASLSPSQGGGSVTAWKHQASASDCFVASDAMQLLVGSLSFVDIAGIRLDVAVVNADVDWGAGLGLPAGMSHWWTASLSCEIQPAPGGANDGTGSEAVVEIATQWGSWARLADAVCTDACEGLGTSVGAASVRIDVSPTLRKNKTITHDPVDHTGKWIRIRPIKTEPRAQRGQVGDPIWWGKILSSTLSCGGGQPATQLLTCAGIGISLHQIEPHRWYAVGQSEAHDPGEVLPVNNLPAGDRADGTTAYKEHDAAGKAGDRWTARDLAETLLDSLEATYVGGPKWTLGGQIAALSYMLQPMDLRGRTALEMLGEIISPRNGVVFRLEIDASTGAGVVRVCSTRRTAITEVDLDIDIPASDRILVTNNPTTGAPQSLLDLDRPDTPAAEVSTDRSAEVDLLHIEGGKPWLMATLAFKDEATDLDKYSLKKGWTDEEETAWTAATTEQRNDPSLAHVWRRFMLRDEYKGTGYFHTASNRVAQVTRTTVTDARLGTDGENGKVTGTISDKTLPKGRNYRFTRDLPIWNGKDWKATIVTSAVVENGRFDYQVRTPMAWTRDDALAYRSLSETMRLSVDDDTPSVVFGHGAEDAETIRTLVSAKAGKLELLITVGIVAPQPWRVSWRRDPATRPCDLTRSLTIRHPDVHWRGVVSGSMIGIKADGTAQQVDTGGEDVALLGFGLPNAPETARLVALLRIARLWYDAPSKSITWTQEGVVDGTVGTAPGSLVGDVRLRLDKGRVLTETVNAVVTGRRWSFARGNLQTTWQAERLKIDGTLRIAQAAPAIVPMQVPLGINAGTRDRLGQGRTL